MQIETLEIMGAAFAPNLAQTIGSNPFLEGYLGQEEVRGIVQVPEYPHYRQPLIYENPTP